MRDLLLLLFLFRVSCLVFGVSCPEKFLVVAWPWGRGLGGVALGAWPCGKKVVMPAASLTLILTTEF